MESTLKGVGVEQGLHYSIKEFRVMYGGLSGWCPAGQESV